MKKKLLLAISIFLTLGGFAMASSRLPDGSIPDERLMEKLKTAIHILSAYHGTDMEKQRQDSAKSFLDKVSRNRSFNNYIPLAFDGVYDELLSEYNKAKLSGNTERMNAMYRGINKNKSLRTEYGLK